jgi:16S rRNA (adenine1518-N6/adenine1519-N6)-dimethyltransferase
MTPRPPKPSRSGGPRRPGKRPRPGRRPTTGTASPPADSPGRAARQTTAYLRKLFAEVGFTIDARKGQNFLVDLNLLDLLERSAAIQPDDVVLEVGGGTAALTERLSRAAFRVVTAEIDPRLATLARDRLIDAENVTIVEGDVLARKHQLAPAVLNAVTAAEADRRAAGHSGRFLLVANLPYCVATPVISNLLMAHPFASATVTVQREMGERMIATAGSHSYNALSVWVGAQCRGEIVRILPPSAFWPRPKVDSAIVHLELDENRRSRIENLPRFHDFVRNIFCHRRKVLRGVLVRMAGGKQLPEAVEKIDQLFADFGFQRSIRAEAIDPDTFVRLEQAFASD